MANYVYQKIICSKKFLDSYLIDYYPISQNDRIVPPYISFNRLVGVSDLSEYREKFGEHIYYGDSFTYSECENGLFEVKFTTKRDYPIAAIRRAIEVEHSVEWFAVEDNCIYVSHFYWSDGIKESIHTLGSAFGSWYSKQYELEESLEDSDHLIWYYLNEHKCSWILWSDSLPIPRFF
ncbi:hypothetical protein [Streptococcus pantholopis]|uniref:Uncharacterized protein n=1 Tax=Streptococcus pantholopis TaxID=1811193 RepID=A0A172Q6M0_9STRE|nr:hypothetical protein [Streptococcus pantholopis]AND79108.1 hypothetical protein A0O21_03245 [Streptococcus pantholopis]